MNLMEELDIKFEGVDLKFELPKNSKGEKIKPVWQDAKATDAEKAVFKDWVDSNREDLINLHDQWAHLISFCNDRNYNWSPEWENYGGAFSMDTDMVLTKSVEDCSIGLGERYVSTEYDDVNLDHDYAKEIVYADTANVTQQSIINIYAKRHGIKFEDVLKYSPVISDRVAEHMRRTFAFKWMMEYPRPLNYAIATHKKEFGTPAAFTPGHPSLPDGHGTNAKATVLECENIFGLPAHRQLKQMANEFTWARNGLWLHWPIDGWASTALVDYFAKANCNSVA